MARKQLAQREFLHTLKENTTETINLDLCHYEKASLLHTYWGIEPNKEPTIDCLIPILKLRDCMQLKIKATILIADVHAELNRDDKITDNKDNTPKSHMKTTNDIAAFYEVLFKLIIDRLGMHTCSIKRGSDIQLNREYVIDLFRLMKETKIDDAHNIGRGIVSATHDNKVSSLMYPLMQIVDEAILNANIQIGSVTQKAIYEYANSIANKPRTYLIHEHTTYGITFMDNDYDIQHKCHAMSDDVCLSVIKHIIIPIYGKFNSCIKYDDVLTMLNDKDLTITDMRVYLVSDLIKIIKPIRNTILNISNIKNTY